jgi:hypothetical protein
MAGPSCNWVVAAAGGSLLALLAKLLFIALSNLITARQLTCEPSWSAILSNAFVCQFSPVKCSSISRTLCGTLGMASSKGAASQVLSCSDCRLVRLFKLCSPLLSTGCGTLDIEVKASRSRLGMLSSSVPVAAAEDQVRSALRARLMSGQAAACICAAPSGSATCR